MPDGWLATRAVHVATHVAEAGSNLQVGSEEDQDGLVISEAPDDEVAKVQGD